MFLERPPISRGEPQPLPLIKFPSSRLWRRPLREIGDPAYPSFGGPGEDVVAVLAIRDEVGIRVSVTEGVLEPGGDVVGGVKEGRGGVVEIDEFAKDFGSYAALADTGLAFRMRSVGGWACRG